MKKKYDIDRNQPAIPDKDFYLAQFLEKIEKEGGHNGIPSSQLRGIENVAEKLLEKCASACEFNDYRQAFYMASAVAEAMVETRIQLRMIA